MKVYEGERMQKKTRSGITIIVLVLISAASVLYYSLTRKTLALPINMDF